MGWYDIYPPVKVYIAMENHQISIGKSHMSRQFSGAMLNYQRVISLENPCMVSMNWYVTSMIFLG